MAVEKLNFLCHSRDAKKKFVVVSMPAQEIAF
jgi:hypothetical protein